MTTEKTQDQNDSPRDDQHSCKGPGKMQLCRHRVLVQDPDDDRKRWRWDCKRLKGHTGEHASTNTVRTFVWRDDDKIIHANSHSVAREKESV